MEYQPLTKRCPATAPSEPGINPGCLATVGEGATANRGGLHTVHGQTANQLDGREAMLKALMQRSDFELTLLLNAN
jgi:hypothetical protein